MPARKKEQCPLQLQIVPRLDANGWSYLVKEVGSDRYIYSCIIHGMDFSELSSEQGPGMRVHKFDSPRKAEKHLKKMFGEFFRITP